MSVIGRVARNTSWTLAASLWGKLAGAIFIIVASRTLGVVEVGRFSTVQVVLFFFLFLANLGFSQTAVREIAKDRARADEIFVNVFTLRTISAGLALLVLALFLVWHPYDGEMRLFFLIMAITIPTTVISDSALGLFTAHERLEVPAKVGSALTLFTQVGGITALLAGFGLREVFVVFAASHLLFAAYNIHLVRREFSGHRFHLDPTLARELLRDTLPLGLLIVMTIIHGKVDLLMLSKIPGGTSIEVGGIPEFVAVGCYAVGYKIFDSVAVVLFALRAALFPTISAAMAENSERVRSAYMRFCSAITLVYGLPLVLLAPFGARWLLGTLFGDDFVLATVPVIILSFAYALYAYNAIMIPILINSARLMRFAGYGFVVIFLNIALNAWWIPEYSLYGAAAATLVSTIAMMIIKLRILSGEFAASAWFPVPGRVALPAALALLCAMILSAVHPVAAMVGGALIYFAGLHFFGVMPPEDRALLTRFISRLRAS